MNQPQLFRRLSQAAAAQDEKGVREALAALARESGWANDVEDFIARLPDRELLFVNDCRGTDGELGSETGDAS